MALRDRLRVMVVDDMSVSRGLLVNALEGFGISYVTHERDGQDALKTMLSNPVHLVISDFNMPNMNGLELLRAIRTNKAIQKTGFIMVTGSDKAELIQAGKKLGMNNYLKKPFNESDLRKCVEAVVGKL